jgi:hypothetical protein
MTPKAAAKVYVKINIQWVKIHQGHVGSAFYYLGIIRGRGDIVDQTEYIKLMMKKFPSLIKDFISEKDNSFVRMDLNKSTIEWLEKLSLLQ